jgi:DNA-binding FadR family transcriptional regulator
MQYNGGILRKSEIKSLLEIRLVLETLALELGVPDITDEALQALAKLASDFEASHDPSESARAIFAFHHELCVISGNTLLPLIFYSFREPVLALWERYFRLHGTEALRANTAELYDRIAHRDSAGAVATLRESLEKTIKGGVSIYFE